jgi:TetR/AcrR family transcriptional regulator
MPPDHPPVRQGEERRVELIRAAIEVFGEAGYAGGRIDEVARRVGIRRPSVLYHFPDKQALYLASISDVVQDISDRVLATENQPGERLEAISDAWVDFVIERPNAARLLLRQMIDATPLPITDTSLPVGRLFASIQAAIDEQAAYDSGKSLDASEFSLILSSTSLVWVAGRNAVKGALGFDTLAPQSMQRHRRTLHSLVRQLLDASHDAAIAPVPEPGSPANPTRNTISETRETVPSSKRST